MSDSVVEIKELKKSFKVGDQQVPVLKGLSFVIDSGDFTMIIGPSGCGKSTLLHIILGLEEPTSGEITFLGKRLYDHTNEDDRSDFRKNNIGMVYQMSNWIKSLTVQENVAFPLLLQGMEKPKALMTALEKLRRIGMDGWAHYIPTELSSGQQQRVALARAMINDPKVIIADEPTGNLDYDAGQGVMALLKEMNEKMGKTVIMVTHDLEYSVYANKIVRMKDGEIVDIHDKSNIKEVIEDIKFKRISVDDIKARGGVTEDSESTSSIVFDNQKSPRFKKGPKTL